ncbi:MAG: cytidine deaminase [Bdellovibrionales bacterium]|nr:cytidine deaminase [Bdellovibrionales bacterium]
MTTIDKAALIAAAKDASRNAYVPASNFRVGAAVQLSDDTIVGGCNVENASFGLTICGERNAIFHAQAARGQACGGKISVVAIAIYTETSEATMPCGACRQVLVEFAGPDTPVFSACRGETVEKRLGDLLPDAFTFAY